MVGHEVHSINADSLKYNYFDILEQRGGAITWSAGVSLFQTLFTFILTKLLQHSQHIRGSS